VAASADTSGDLSVEGPPDGRPIIFVHGAGVSRAQWRPQIVGLSDEFRVVAMDLPGHGVRGSEPFDFDRAVEAVASVLDQIGEPCLLVGHSLGGYVSATVAGGHPERVAGLVLSGSSADYRGRLGTRSRLAGTVLRLAGSIGPVERWFERYTLRKVRDKPVDGSTAASIRDGGVSLRAYGESARDLAGRDVRSDLRSYSGPTLLLNGSEDRLNGNAASDLAAVLDDARVETLAGAGHTANLDRPDEYTATIRSFADEVDRDP